MCVLVTIYEPQRPPSSKGTPHVQGAAVDDEFIKGFYLGVPEPPCGFRQFLSHTFQKMEDLIGTDIPQWSLSMNRIKPVKQQAVALDGSLMWTGERV